MARTKKIKVDEGLQVFSSIRESLETTAHEINQDAINFILENPDHQGFKWLGTDYHTDVYKLLKNGWPKGVERVNELSGSITVPAPKNIKRRLTRGDYGDDLDMQRVYNGDLENAWSRRERKQGIGPKLITLVINIGASCFTKSDELFWRGASALKLSELLTEAGYQVEILAFTSSSHTYPNKPRLDSTTIWTVKPFTAPLEVNTLAAVICLAGFFRVVGFSMRANLPYKISPTLGSTINRTPPSIEGDYLIDEFHKVTDKHDAVDKVNSEIERLENSFN